MHCLTDAAGRRGNKVQDSLAMLRRERNSLLNEWMTASPSEKVKLLVKIMDLDEQISREAVKPVRRQQIV